jgi:hypothetical protein
MTTPLEGTQPGSARLLLLLIPIVVTAAAQAFQAKPDTPPQFEAATIKPSDPAFRAGRMTIFPVITPPGRLIVQNATLKDLIAGVYSAQAYQITGGPAWISSTGSAPQDSRLKEKQTAAPHANNAC